MASYSIAQVRTHFSDVIDQAEERGAVEITRRGKRVAVLLSDREYQKLAGKPDIFDRIMEFRQRHAQDLDDEPALLGIPVLAYNEEAARWHTQERSRLDKIGLRPQFEDGQIASVANCVEEIHCLIMKARNLRTTRDLLLPKLISGEIDVSKIPLPTP